MNIEAVGLPNMAQSNLSKGADDASSARKKVADIANVDLAETEQVQPEELLQQIKGLTEDGLYSVRFENDERSDTLVVKIVDRKNDEVIRQVPAEEVLDLRDALDSLRGNVINTEG